MKRCQFCAEEIQDEAIVCKHCGRELAPGAAAKASPATAAQRVAEQTILEERMHWIVFRRPAIWLGLALLLSAGPSSGPAMFFVFVAVVDAIGRAITRANTIYQITTRRLVMSTGLLKKRSLELSLTKLESMSVSEPFFGRMLGYGTVVVGGTGGTKEAFPFVPDPQKFRTTAQDLAHV